MQQSLFATTEPKLPGYPAVFSADRAYRYCLWRVWTDDPTPSYLQGIGVNPSDADEEDNDNTLVRMIRFAKSWGFGALCMTNLNCYVNKDQAVMRAQRDPIGDDADYWLATIAAGAGMSLACWGNGGSHLNRDKAVVALFKAMGKDLYCLKLNKDGSPFHPLFAPANLQPILFRPHPPGTEGDNKEPTK
jgi:hypothetical protein